MYALPSVHVASRSSDADVRLMQLHPRAQQWQRKQSAYSHGLQANTTATYHCTTHAIPFNMLSLCCSRVICLLAPARCLQLVLRSINSARSAFLAVTLSAQFFESYNLFASTGLVQAGVLLKVGGCMPAAATRLIVKRQQSNTIVCAPAQIAPATSCRSFGSSQQHGSSCRYHCVNAMVQLLSAGAAVHLSLLLVLPASSHTAALAVLQHLLAAFRSSRVSSMAFELNLEQATLTVTLKCDNGALQEHHAAHIQQYSRLCPPTLDECSRT